MNPVLEAALAYAAKGWVVFPAPKNTKRSHIAGKKKGGARWGATRDPELLTKYWKRWPDAAIGLPTGEENGIWVLEIDTQAGHGVDGAASLAALQAEHGDLPVTLTARSPSGSLHYFFEWPGRKVFNSASAIGPGVDVRGSGGMVICAPSTRKDGAYRWLNEGQAIATAPPWLIQATTLPTRDLNAPSASAAPGRPHPADNYYTQYGNSAHPSDPKAVLGAMRRGNVHESQVKATASMLNSGTPIEDVVQAVLGLTRAMPHTHGWDWDEEEILIRDMCKTWQVRLAKEAEDKATQDEEEIGELPEDAFQDNDDQLPIDEWLYGRHIMRGEVAGTAAPGGVGKSTLSIAEALCMASGQNLLGNDVPSPTTVLLINLEDNRMRMRKRIKAAMKKYDLTNEDIGQRLHMWAKGDVNVVIAKPTKNTGEVKRQDIFFNKLLTFISHHNIDVISIDPFVRTHQVAENDNVAIAKVITFFEQIAQQGKCGVSIWHHTRKMSGDGASPTVDSARGASSFVDACRSVRLLETMTEKQAKSINLEPGERKRIFSSYSGKLNYAPPIEESDWYRLDSVALYGDSFTNETVGVVERFELPPPQELTEEQIDALKAAIEGPPRWRDSVQSGMWVGNAIAPHVGTDDKRQLKGIVADLIKKNVLRKLEGKDEKRMQRLFVVTTDWRPPDGTH